MAAHLFVCSINRFGVVLVTRNMPKRSLDGRDGFRSLRRRSETRVAVSGALVLTRTMMAAATVELGNLLVVCDALSND